MRRRLILWALLTGLAAATLVGCTVTPGMNLGVDFDYYGGKFHARPTAGVNLYGRP